MKTGPIEKGLSAVVFGGCLWVLVQGGHRGLVKLLPIFMAPVTMIWFPEGAAEYFSTRVTGDTIRNWGWGLLLLLAVPAVVAAVALRG